MAPFFLRSRCGLGAWLCHAWRFCFAKLLFVLNANPKKRQRPSRCLFCAPGATRTHNRRLRSFRDRCLSRTSGGSESNNPTYGGSNCPMCASYTVLPLSLHVGCTPQIISHPTGLPICHRSSNKYEIPTNLCGDFYYLTTNA